VTYIVEHIRNAFRETFEEVVPGTEFHERRLLPTDGQYAIGLRVANWQHLPTSAQIGQVEPGLGVFTVQVQNMVKGMDEVQALKIYDVQCSLVRAVLYRNAQLRLRLFGVDEEISGSAERPKRMGVRKQDFLDNRVGQQFTYLCVTEVYIETEITLL